MVSNHRSITHVPLLSTGNLMVILSILALMLALPSVARSNPDVYGVLPADTRVLQFAMADLDGDAREELAVLYTTGDETRLTLFREETGRWSRWWDDNGTIAMKDGSTPKSLEITDINGDQKAEMLAYYLTERNTAMTARVMALSGQDEDRPFFRVILEDTTSPAGYPLLGMEKQEPSVTFMRMPTRKSDGYRRVYCWTGEVFEVCKEVVWEKP
jgi:hypothetical protein